MFKNLLQKKYNIVKLVTDDFEDVMLPKIGELLEEAAQIEIIEEFKDLI